jgi:uncharacterized protein
MTKTTPHNAPIESRERQRDRRRTFSIFFSVFFAVYSLVNTYIFIRLNQGIPENCWLNGIFAPLFIFVALSYIVGQILERKSSSFISDGLTWIGAFWLGAIAWLIPAFVIIDLVKLANSFFGFLPNGLLQRTEVTQGTTMAVVIVVFVSMFLGFLNARNIRVKPIPIKIDKPGGKPLRIAALSDMHMGTIIGKRMVKQMVRK